MRNHIPSPESLQPQTHKTEDIRVSIKEGIAVITVAAGGMVASVIGLYIEAYRNDGVPFMRRPFVQHISPSRDLLRKPELWATDELPPDEPVQDKIPVKTP